MYVCLCYNITQETIEENIKLGLSKEELARKLHCMTSCGSCEGTIDYLIEEHKGNSN